MKKYAFWKRMSAATNGNVAELAAQIKNTYINKIYNVWMSKFKWSGLDEDLKDAQQNFIMRKLWSEGTVAARPIASTDMMAYTQYAAAEYDMYDFPSKVSLVKNRGVSNAIVPQTTQIVNKDVVLLFAQPNHKSIYSMVNFYVDRMVDVDLCINTNLVLQRMPFLIGVTESDRKRMEDVVERIIAGEPAIFTDLEDLQRIQAVVTAAPYIVDKLTAYRASVENELLTFLGIDNIGSNQKTERMLVDEVNATNDIINDYGNAIESEIKAGLERINKVFGRSIKVEAVSKPVEAKGEGAKFQPKSEMKDGGVDNEM